ncbi:hypothetical protein HT105_24470, partial [Bacteroides fragilis]|nr:hypothetical protein [Bacteroides fragilis]
RDGRAARGPQPAHLGWRTSLHSVLPRVQPAAGHRKRSSVSGMMMPVMQFISYLSYVVIAVMGALRVAHSQLTLGGAQAFIQYSREFNQPLG